MKNRFGFVSNSSSSSFVIQKSSHISDRETVELILEKLVEVYNLTYGENFLVSDICWVSDLDDVDEVGVRGLNFCNKNKLTLKQYKLLQEHTDEIPGFEISSNYDNSIPYIIQSFLENIGTRYHWG